MNSFVFKTKAQTLNNLRGKLHRAQVAPLFFFTYQEWKTNKILLLENLKRELGVGSYIVRSSCSKEDSAVKSNAGAFLSLLNVSVDELEYSVNQVFLSYENVTPDEEVLIQPMLQNVLRSGVAFTHDPATGAPYRIINWLDGNDTTGVTSGSKRGRIWQSSSCAQQKLPVEIFEVGELLNELLALAGNCPMDCEFAYTLEKGKEALWLLQARPLILAVEIEDEKLQEKRLGLISAKVARGMSPNPFLLGKRTVYGVMPDWNPAEIIGVRPKPLSLSLYRELVTDSIWAYQRNNYGYRNLRSHPLMPHFFGLPYIDVRLSFNSFIPADLDEGIAGRLVDYYINRLISEPSLHDKVEFEIVYSCYTLDLPQRLEKLSEAGFTQEEQKKIADSLRTLTNKIIHPEDGLWKADAEKLEVLNSRREELLNSDADPLERIYWLLEDAKRYGTLPFAGLARAGFIAVQMLKSLVAVNVLSEDDYDSFMSSISTVSGQLSRDRIMLDRSTFLARYGHLRPGTYDLLSPRYDEAPDLYFDWSQKTAMSEKEKTFSLTLPQMRKIVTLLNEHGLHPDGVGLFDFLQAGIELREMSKFHFTRNLSDALSLMIAYGENLGFSREDIAYCDFNVFKELYVAAADPKEIIQESIAQGKKRYKETLATALPPLIVSPDDVFAFEWPDTSPNFITQKEIIAEVFSSECREKISGAIVCIPNADPGYDWLFSYPIAGLITAWGGVNSHMAIRAGELGIPAVIGAGELLYKKWSTAQRIHLDCASRKVEVLA